MVVKFEVEDLRKMLTLLQGKVGLVEEGYMRQKEHDEICNRYLEKLMIAVDVLKSYAKVEEINAENKPDYMAGPGIAQIALKKIDAP